MKHLIAPLFALVGICTASAAPTDKTLVAWVTLADKSVRAGAVLTIQDGPRFDGIVFAEKVGRPFQGLRRGWWVPGAMPERPGRVDHRPLAGRSVISLSPRRGLPTCRLRFSTRRGS